MIVRLFAAIALITLTGCSGYSRQLRQPAPIRLNSIVSVKIHNVDNSVRLGSLEKMEANASLMR